MCGWLGVGEGGGAEEGIRGWGTELVQVPVSQLCFLRATGAVRQTQRQRDTII